MNQMTVEKLITAIKKQMELGNQVALGQPEIQILQMEAARREAKHHPGAKIRNATMRPSKDGTWLAEYQIGYGRLLNWYISAEVSNLQGADKRTGGLFVDEDTVIVNGSVGCDLVGDKSKEQFADIESGLGKLFGIENLGICLEPEQLVVWDIDRLTELI